MVDSAAGSRPSAIISLNRLMKRKQKMQRRFKGQFLQKVDSKGRMTLPADFRRVLENCDPEFQIDQVAQTILVYGDKRRPFFEGYSILSIAMVDEKISQMKTGSREQRAMERMFSGQAVHVYITESGQFVLTNKLREKLGITNEAFFTATGDTFQIWRPETFAEHEIDIEDLLDAGDDPKILLSRTAED